MRRLSFRERSILAGLYLSKFDTEGLTFLGFGSFTEAYNVIGYAIGARPTSVKNYRDEFDPLFPNARKGWHKRPIREHCKVIYDEFGNLGLDEFAPLLKEIIYKYHAIDVLMEEVARKKEGARVESFAKMLITGQAAEEYFRLKYKEIGIFSGFEIEDATRLGCGFDFRLVSSRIYYGVEVKGLNEPSGNIVLTDKEHSVAGLLKNFREEPFHEIYQNPLTGKLNFSPLVERRVETTWIAKA